MIAVRLRNQFRSFHALVVRALTLYVYTIHSCLSTGMGYPQPLVCSLENFIRIFIRHVTLRRWHVQTPSLKLFAKSLIASMGSFLCCRLTWKKLRRHTSWPRLVSWRCDMKLMNWDDFLRSPLRWILRKLAPREGLCPKPTPRCERLTYSYLVEPALCLRWESHLQRVRFTKGFCDKDRFLLHRTRCNDCLKFCLQVNGL